MESASHGDTIRIGLATAGHHSISPSFMGPPVGGPLDCPPGMPRPQLRGPPPPPANDPTVPVAFSANPLGPGPPDAHSSLQHFRAEAESILRYGPGTEPTRKPGPPPPSYYNSGYSTRHRGMPPAGPGAPPPPAMSVQDAPADYGFAQAMGAGVPPTGLPPRSNARYTAVIDAELEAEREGSRERERQRKSRAGGARGNSPYPGEKPHKGPQAGWKNQEPKRTPTLGQMAAQVQAHAQSQARANGLPEDDPNDSHDLTPCPAGSEHTGRWTRLEHERFLMALKKYGKEWKKVASSVRTRTVVQTRTHAQKYFQKLQKVMATGMDLEQALEMTMDVSDDEDDMRGGRYRKRRNMATPQPPPAPRAPSQRRHTPMPASRPPPPSADYSDDDDDDDDRRGGDDDDDSYSGTDDDITDDRAAEAIRRVAASPNLGPSRPPAPDRVRTFRPELYLPQPASQQGQASHSSSSSSLSSSNHPNLSIAIPPPPGSHVDDSHPAGPGAHGGWERRAPQPSPAACGKRKHAELAVAEVLAAAAHQDTIEAVDVLSHLRGGSMDATNSTNGSDDGAGHRSQRRRMDLTILSPDEVGAIDNPHRHASGAMTPWDAEVRALSAFGDRATSEEGPISALQMEVVSLVSRGEVDGLRTLLEKAKADGQQARGGVPTTGSDLDIHGADEAGRTPLMIAAGLDPAMVEEKKAVELCQLLVENAASPSATDKTRCTALHWAARRGNAGVVRFLVSRGCPLNTQNFQGDTPLHWASKASQMGAIKALIENGAAAHMRNARNQSPLDVAASGFEQGDSHCHSTPFVADAGIETKGDAMDVDVLSVPVSSTSRREAVRRTIVECEPRQRTLIVYHPECLDHQPSSKDDWEVPERVEAVMERLKDPQAFQPYALDITSTFERASVEDVSKVHSREYVQYLHDLSKEVSAMGPGATVPFKPFAAAKQQAAVPPCTMQADASTQTGSMSPTPDSATAATAAPPSSCPGTGMGGSKQQLFSAGSLNAARRSAGAVVTAVDKVVSGRNRNAFCVVRPPGHHAGPNGMTQLSSNGHHNQGSNGCGLNILNNVAIGAMRALESRCERVAIIDIDAHHGDGTEEFVRSFRESNRLLFFSMHLHDKGTGSGAEGASSSAASGAEAPVAEPCFYPGTGDSDDVAHNIYNVALTPLWRDGQPKSRGPGEHKTPYRGRADFRHVVTERLIPTLRSFNPKLILLSTGLDILSGDVGSCRYQSNGAGATTNGSGDSAAPAPTPTWERGLDLNVDDIAWVTQKLQGIADICCNGRMVSVLEGGYGCADCPAGLDRSVLREAAAAHVSALVDPRPPVRVAEPEADRSAAASMGFVPVPSITVPVVMVSTASTSTSTSPVDINASGVKVETIVNPEVPFQGVKTRQ